MPRNRVSLGRKPVSLLKFFFLTQYLEKGMIGYAKSLVCLAVFFGGFGDEFYFGVICWK